MAAGAADTPGNGWQSRSVMIVRGQGDTRIKNGEDYDTLTLASLFALAPGNRPKRNGLAFIPSSYHGHDGRQHAAQREHGCFVALAGDVDRGNHPLERFEPLVRQFADGAAYLIFSTAKAIRATCGGG